MRIRLGVAGVVMVASILTGCGSGGDDASSDGGTETTTAATGGSDTTGAASSPDPADGVDQGSGGAGLTMTYPTTADVTELIDPSLVYSPAGGDTDCQGTTAQDSVCTWDPPAGDLDGTGQVQVRCGFYGAEADAFVDQLLQEVTGSGRKAEELEGLGTPAVFGAVPNDPGYFISAFVEDGDRLLACAFNLYAPYDGDAGTYGEADEAGYKAMLTALAQRSFGQEA